MPRNLLATVMLHKPHPVVNTSLRQTCQCKYVNPIFQNPDSPGNLQFSPIAKFSNPFLSYRYRFNQKNRPEHNIRMYWTNFWQPTVYVQQNVFEKIVIEVYSPHLHASFSIFCVHNGFAAHWVFKQSQEFQNQRHFPSITVIFRFSKTHFVSTNLGAIGSKRSTYMPWRFFCLNL